MRKGRALVGATNDRFVKVPKTGRKAFHGTYLGCKYKSNVHNGLKQNRHCRGERRAKPCAKPCARPCARPCAGACVGLAYCFAPNAAPNAAPQDASRYAPNAAPRCVQGCPAAGAYCAKPCASRAKVPVQLSSFSPLSSSSLRGRKSRTLQRCSGAGSCGASREKSGARLGICGSRPSRPWL